MKKQLAIFHYQKGPQITKHEIRTKNLQKSKMTETGSRIQNKC